MSWFDASGLASIAKSALKEAQRTIDKALDIQEDVSKLELQINSDGKTNFESNSNSNSNQVQTALKSAPANETFDKKALINNVSLWGSFTGSFFEGPKAEKVTSLDNLDDSLIIGEENFNDSKLVVHNIEESEKTVSILPVTLLTTFNESDKKDSTEDKNINTDGGFDDSIDFNKHKSSKNRLSVVSSESGKTSSESVEILNSGTDCTTSPESDLQLGTSTGSGSIIKSSESLEILPDSLTSPSSIEIIPTDTDTPCTPQNVVDLFSSSLEKISYDNEPFMDNVDDSSIAEESLSYASASENTINTILEISSNMSTKLLMDSEKLNEPITKGPSKSTLHLSLGLINSQLIDTQPQSYKDSIVDLVENVNVIDIPEDNRDGQGDDDGSQSDKTIIANDSIMESSSDTSTTESNANSFYLKNMLADAMSEQSGFIKNLPVKVDSVDVDLTIPKTSEITSIIQLEMPPRENSPLSSESRSDLVKIGSDETSGHTSGDENETTTSSDIEIISSPNGDSSSTQSRQSPAKLLSAKGKIKEASVDNWFGKITLKNIKGHNRELSEASSISDDSHSSEIERLIKRITEITDILELRETKLIEVNRHNNELQEINNELQHQLDVILTKQIESADLSQLTEEYTQRLSVLERKFQQAIRDKDLLKKQLDQCKLESLGKLNKSEVHSLLSEKDIIIKELREEGEKLSKQQLQHSNIIKKLRAKEKEYESSIKNLKENIEDITSESERLKRSLIAKEEVERLQIEAVHQLSSKNKKLEYETTQLKSNYEDLQQKYETVKKSLETAKKELLDKNKTNQELYVREQMLQNLEIEKRMTESQNEEIVNQLEDMRFKLQQGEQEYLKKEQLLRNENSELLKRLEETERRNEELAQNTMEISKPLVRQLETLQATHNMKINTSERTEQIMQLKINDLQKKLHIITESECSIRGECLDLKTKVSTLETQLNSEIHKNETAKVQLETHITDKTALKKEFHQQIDILKTQLEMEQKLKDKLKGDLSTLEHQLETTINKEKSLHINLQDESDLEQRSKSSNSVVTPTTSPTLSLRRLSENLTNSPWLQDDQLESTPAPRYTNILEMQLLETNLKQKEGEVQQLQWQLNRREQEKNLLSIDISKLLTKVEDLESKGNQYMTLHSQFVEIQQKYDTLCQLYGEKVEECEELRLDLSDIKELYKSQLDELLNRQNN